MTGDIFAAKYCRKLKKNNILKIPNLKFAKIKSQGKNNKVK